MHPQIKFELQGKLINKILIFFIFLNFFLPKLTILNIPGFSQGIRFENIICFFMLITLIVGKRLSLTSKDYKILKPYLTFFVIILISSYVGWSNGIKIQFIFVLRILEYLVFCFLIFKSQITLKTIEKIVKLFYFACFIGIILQHFKLMGTFTSVGIDTVGENKYTAFTSGSWELAFMISISYFIILTINNNEKKKENFIYLFLTLIIIFLAGSRSLFLSFLITIPIYYIFKSRTLNIKLFLYLFLFLLPFISFFILNQLELRSLNEYDYKINENPNKLIENILNLDFNYIYQTYKDFLLYGYVRDIADTAQQYTSLQYRLIHWNWARENFLLNSFTIIFGSGAEALYYDSIIFRILFTTGIIGTLFFLVVLTKIPFYLLVFFFFSGLTIDYITSYKLAITTILLHYVILKKLKNEDWY